jgi:hypothetical protein
MGLRKPDMGIARRRCKGPKTPGKYGVFGAVAFFFRIPWNFFVLRNLDRDKR